MSNVTMEDIKKLREETGAGVMDAKKALEDSDGDLKKAKDWIQKKGLARAEKKADRDASEGIIYSYIHHDMKSGAMIELACETDFVARTDDFEALAKMLAMQVVSNNPENIPGFLAEDFQRDPSKKVEDVIKEATGKLGEKIELKRFVRFKMGEA